MLFLRLDKPLSFPYCGPTLADEKGCRHAEAPDHSQHPVNPRLRGEY